MKVTALAVTALVGALFAGQGSVRAVVEQDAPTAGGEVTLRLRVRPEGMSLGAYQGTLRFTPGAFEILSAQVPNGDGTRVVNAADSAQGIVRFAGFAVPAFRQDIAVTLVVRPVRALSASGLRAVLEVAADADGVAVPRDSLIGSERLITRP